MAQLLLHSNNKVFIEKSNIMQFISKRNQDQEYVKLYTHTKKKVGQLI